ncbi:hypothetical protein ONZ45_g16713 [Pleurotus djamor]|nr:hypothetical protein ONZ45_g16713 [Pleurotus djamor]
MLVQLAFVLLAVVVLASLRSRTAGDVSRLPSVPSSISHWMFGHELLVFVHDASQMYSTWAQSLGRVFRLSAALFHPDIVVVTDHRAIHHIFSLIDLYGKDRAFRQLISLAVGRGIVWAEGSEYATQKRLLSPAFTAEAVKDMAPDVIQCAEELESKLTAYVNSHADNGKTVLIDVIDQFSACALDIFGRVGLCHDFGALKAIPITSNHVGVRVQSETDATRILHAWTQLIHSSRQFSAFFMRVVIRAFPIISDLPLPGMKSVSSQTIQQLAKPLLEKALRDCHSDHQGKDILSILVREGSGLTEDQIIQNMSTLLTAGHETVAGTVAFILYELARSPTDQARLRQELLERGLALYNDIDKLPYLDAVVKEGFRLHPASPITERVALADDVIPLSEPIQAQDGTLFESLHVKKGQVFVIPFKAINTCESVWGSDGSAFRPTRWLNEPGVENGGIPLPSQLPQGWSGLVSFSDGPRRCLGIKLGIFEVKVLVATLIRSLSFRATGQIVRTVPLPTLQPVVGDIGGILPLFISLAPVD